MTVAVWEFGEDGNFSAEMEAPDPICGPDGKFHHFGQYKVVDGGEVEIRSCHWGYRKYVAAVADDRMVVTDDRGVQSSFTRVK
jgi:hypothetical protein